MPDPVLCKDLLASQDIGIDIASTGGGQIGITSLDACKAKYIERLKERKELVHAKTHLFGHFREIRFAFVRLGRQSFQKGGKPVHMGFGKAAGYGHCFNFATYSAGTLGHQLIDIINYNSKRRCFTVTWVLQRVPDLRHDPTGIAPQTPIRPNISISASGRRALPVAIT